MDTVLEPQATPEVAQPAAAAEKKSLFKRLPKWALYAALALIVAIVLAFGYTQHWFKAGTVKAKEVLSAVMPAAAEKAPAAATTDALATARQAFASGNVQGAISGYKEVLAKNPDDVNAMGELGNVLYTTGWIPQATQTYYDAASKALDQNKPEVAEALLPVLMQNNPMLASQLQDRMFEMESRAMDAQMDAQMKQAQSEMDAQMKQAQSEEQAQPQMQTQPQAPVAPAQHG